MYIIIDNDLECYLITYLNLRRYFLFSAKNYINLHLINLKLNIYYNYPENKIYF